MANSKMSVLENGITPHVFWMICTCFVVGLLLWLLTSTILVLRLKLAHPHLYAELGRPDVSQRPTGVLAKIRKHNAPLPRDIKVLFKACSFSIHATAWLGVIFMLCVLVLRVHQTTA